MKLWAWLILGLMPMVAQASDCEPDGEYLFSQSSDSVVYQQISDEPGASFDRSIAFVSVPTFEVFERDGCVTDYAKDINRVYYKGSILENVKPNHFFPSPGMIGIWEAGDMWVKDGQEIADMSIFSNGYYHAAGKSYHEQTELEHVLTDVKGQFGITDQKIYFQGKETDFDPNTFKALKHYALDAYKLYYYVGSEIVEIEGVDPQSFVEFEDQKLLAADYQAYYFEGHVIPSPADYIEYYSHGFFRDENQVYFYEQPLPELDPDTFRVHLKGGKYIQDKNGAYFVKRLNFRFAEIEYVPLEAPVDYDSFTVVRHNVAHDNTNVFASEKVVNYTVESLNLTNQMDYESTPQMKFYKPKGPKRIFKKALPKVVKPEVPEPPKPQVKTPTPKVKEVAKTRVPRSQKTEEASTSFDGKMLEVKFTWWQRLLNWLLF